MEKTANGGGRIPRNRSVIFDRSTETEDGGRAMPADSSLDGVRTGRSPPDIVRSRPGVGGGGGESISTMADNGELAASFGGRLAAAASSDCGSPSTVAGSPAQNETSSSSSVDPAARKRSNMTETVRVPTSEHVAEIVGRQGCKIKALRAKTNTYIKTPARGEEPVFIVTGRPEDVAEVKNEILSAAEHFSQIRATRRSAASGDLLRLPAATGSTEQVREKVAVPFWVVGLVVGPKGTTIRRIQQDTQTYIITPGKEREPVFEIIGSAENVARARQEIESYIALRMKPRQGYASSNGWTKSDHRLNELTPPQHKDLRNSSHLNNSSCVLDQELSKEVGMRQSLLNERNWRHSHSSGFLGRPISVDVGEFFRHFPTCQNLSFFREHLEKPQLEIEAVLSNYLSDLNLISHDILKSFINQESNLGLTDLKPLREPNSAGASRMPFAMKSALEDVIDCPLDSSTSFYTVGGSPSEI